MSVNLLEQGLICLEVASSGMETYVAQKNILVIPPDARGAARARPPAADVGAAGPVTAQTQN